MEKIIASLRKRPKATIRINRESSLFQAIITAIKDKKGENIVSLDLKHIDEAVADFFILCEAASDIQIKAIAENIEESIEAKCDEKPYHKEDGGGWTLLDYVNIVVHIFKPEERKFYDLEGLWLDGEQMKHD